MLRYVLAIVLLLSASAALAQTPGACALGTARATLDANDVRATLLNVGNLFYGPGVEGAYEVPALSGKKAAYAGSLWVGGRVSGELRMAGTAFGQGGANNDYFEFWPGPLNDGAALPNPSDCSAYDRIWKVSVQDVARYESGEAPTADLAEWPIGLGAAAVDASGQPIETDDRARTLNLAAGERPVVYGTQTAFWVMNDVGNEHRTTGSAPLGVEVQTTAFAIASAQAALDQATFYRYRVVNRNRQPIEDVRLSWWTDTDLGGVNERQGVDTTRAMGFTYNDVTDTVYDIPPATGVDFLDQPLGAYAYRANGDANRGEPRNAVEYDRTQRGLWNDGTPVTMLGTGYNPNATADLEPTVFAYPGDPVTRSFWSELNTDGQGSETFAGNKRSIPTTQPTDLAPGESVVLTVAFLFAQGGDHLDSVRELRKASDLVQGLFDDGSLLQASEVASAPTASATLQSPGNGIEVLSERVTFQWGAVPAASAYLLEVSSSPEFEDFQTFRTRGTTLTTGELTASQVAPFYWRVVPVNSGGAGPPSDARTFSYYRYVPGPLMLGRQMPAFVETQGPGGVNPCGAAAVSTFGCLQVGGNAVVGSPNGTGDYSIRPPSLNTGVLGEREVEIRWTGTAEGSYAQFDRFSVGRVPFTVWDIGVTPPGGINDPSDDVRLIPVVRNPGPECRFDFSVPSEGGWLLSISAAYPTDDAALFDLERQRGLRLGQDGCVSGTSSSRFRLLDLIGSVPFAGIVFNAEREGLQASDLTGSVIRLYTADSSPPPRFDPDAPGTGEGSVLAPYPNPATDRVMVAFTLDRPGPVSLVVTDVLGREVARLADGEDFAAALHQLTVETDAWASGTYVVFLRTEAGGTSQTFTVVR